jgi:hypothetical protein
MKLSLAICFFPAGAACNYKMLAMGQDVPLRSKLSLPDDYACPSSSLSPKRSSVRAFVLQVCLLHQDDEGIHGTRAEAQDFLVLIAHRIFSSMPVLAVTSPGIPRSRRQLAGL